MPGLHLPCDPFPGAAPAVPQQANGAERLFWSINAHSSHPGKRGASRGIPTRARESGTWKTRFFKLKSW